MSEGSSQAHHEKHFKIVVNGSPTTVEKEVLTFDDVVDIAFPNRDPNTIYSVTFEKAKEPKEGELVPGQSVEIKENTEFDVDDTGKS